MIAHAPVPGAPDPAAFGGTHGDLIAHLGGDLEAFGRLWNRFRPGLEIVVGGKIRATLTPALRAKLDAEFDDLLQDVASTVLAKIGRFEYRGPGSVLAWLRKVAERVVTDRVDYWTAGRRDPIRERALLAPAATADDRDRTGPEAVARCPSPSTDAAISEERGRIRRAMVRLDDRQHDIILLRFFGGADWNEIARQVGAPSGDAVRMECFGKAIPALAALLKEGGEAG